MNNKFEKDIIEEINEITTIDKPNLICLLKRAGILLEYAKEYQNDEDVVLVAVNQNGRSLQYASEELKNNKHIVLVALKNNMDALFFVSPSLKQEIGQCNPREYLERVILHNKLNEEVKQHTINRINKNKI